MDESTLRKMSYKQLQSLAASYRVPGNIKKEIMIKVILAAHHNDDFEVCRILSGIQHTRKKLFKHLKNFNENTMQISPCPTNLELSKQNSRGMPSSPISWGSKIEMASVKTPVHHYLIQHYQNTFLNTFPPPASSPPLPLPPTSLPAILPLPSMNLLPPVMPEWSPQAPIMDLRIEQSKKLLPLDLQRKTQSVLITHTQTSQYPTSERSVLKQLLQPAKNSRADDSDTMTATTDSHDETSTDDASPNSCEPPPYTSPAYPYSSNSVQTQLVSADFWNYQSSSHQIESELEIAAFNSTKDNFNNYECNYPQNNYDGIYSQPEKNLMYLDNENRLNINYDGGNYINNTNGYNFNEINGNINLNNYTGINTINTNDDSNNYNNYKTKDCLINNNTGNIELRDFMNYSYNWPSNKPIEKTTVTSVEPEEMRPGGNEMKGQLESLLNIRDVNDINEVNEKMGQTSSVYCYATPVSSPRPEGDKKRNFKLIAESRSQLFGIKYKVYDDSSTGRAMSYFD